MIALPQCRWRGDVTNEPGRFHCKSPKLVVFRGVAAEDCQGCYCRDHEPVTPIVPAPRPDERYLECFHLGDILDNRGCNCPNKWFRECDLHGKCTLGVEEPGTACCSICKDYTAEPPVGPPDTPDEESSVSVFIDLSKNNLLPAESITWANAQEAHRQMLDEEMEKTHSFPGGFSGRGIVSCVSAKPGWSSGKHLKHGYLPGAWVMVKELRRLGCSLPITFCHLGLSEWSLRLTDIVKPLGVEIINLREWEKSSPWRILNGWESKIAAILACPYNEVMFLDADNLPLVDPTKFFNDPEYQKYGSLFWPDYPPPDRPEWLKKEVWDSVGLPFRNEPDFESGQLLVDKQRCWKSLMATKFINEHSDYWYKIVFGDKTTFHLGWRKTEQDYAIVSHLPGGNGGAIIQYDFQGHSAFQHCTLNKPDLHGWPRPRCLWGYRELRRHLRDLRSVWDGTLWNIDRPSETDAEIETTLVGRSFLYRRIGLDERSLKLIDSHRIGEGMGRCEVSWGVNDGRLLLCDIDGKLTTMLTKNDNESWTGQWEEHERCKIELIPKG